MCRVITPALIAVAFVGAVEYFVGWRLVFYPWRFIDNYWTIIAPAALVALTYLLRTLRLYRYFNMKKDFGLCLRLMLQHNLLLNLLPMRTGEFAFPVLMNRYFSMAPSRTIPALLWLRLLDLHALVLILILVIGFFVSPTLGIVMSVLWVSGLFLVFSVSKKLDAFLANHQAKRVLLLLRNTVSAIPRRVGPLVESWLLTVANWAAKLAVCAWIIQVFSSTDYMIALAGAIGGEASTILPVHGFAALGTYELGVVAAMQIFGISVHDALTGAANLHFLLLGVSIAGGLASLLIVTPSASRHGAPIH